MTYLLTFVIMVGLCLIVDLWASPNARWREHRDNMLVVGVFVAVVLLIHLGLSFFVG